MWSVFLIFDAENFPDPKTFFSECEKKINFDKIYYYLVDINKARDYDIIFYLDSHKIYDIIKLVVYDSYNFENVNLELWIFFLLAFINFQTGKVGDETLWYMEKAYGVKVLKSS